MLAVGYHGTKPSPADCGLLCGEHPEVQAEVTALGVVFDEDLTWKGHLSKCLARLHDTGHNLVGAMASAGFGLPFQTVQYPARVEAASLYGSEVLASYVGG